MLSRPNEGSLAVITMQDANSRAGTPRADDGLHTLTAFIDGDYIPLIFRLSDNKIVSLNAEEAIAFDHYILASIWEVFVYKGGIDETNINEYVDGNQLDCRYDKKHLDTVILIDTESGKVMDLMPLFNYDVKFYDITVGYNDEFIFVPSREWADNGNEIMRIARISKHDLSNARLITPDLESTYLQYVVGDYLITSDMQGLEGSPKYAYQIDDAGQRKDLNSIGPIQQLLIPSDPDMKIAWINGYKYSTDKGNFRKVGTDTETVYNLNDDSLVLKVDSSVFPEITAPYMQSKAIDGFSGAPLYSSRKDRIGNFFMDASGYTYYTIDANGQLENVRKDISGYSCLAHIKKLERFTNSSEKYPMYLYFDGSKYFYFMYEDGQDTRICRLDIVTGATKLSDYTVDLDSAAASYMSLSGTTLIYKTLSTGSRYTTYQVDITDLNTRPVAVDYNPGDVISIPEFRF